MTSNQQRAALQRQIWQIANIAKGANTNESLNTDLAAIFAAIESSANGYPSERDIKGLFADFDTTIARIDQLRSDIDTIVAEIEGGNP